MRNIIACWLFGLLFFLSVCPSSTIAQIDDRGWSNQQNQNTVRERYEGSPNLPDGIAFISVLRMVVSLNSEDADTAEALIIDRMGLDTLGSQDLIRSMETSLTAFDNKVEERGREILCDSGVPRAYGEDGFTLLDAAMSSSDAIAEQHFEEFNATLDKRSTARLRVWINESKRSIGHVRFDQKALAQETGIMNVDSELLALCGDLERSKGRAVQ